MMIKIKSIFRTVYLEYISNILDNNKNEAFESQALMNEGSLLLKGEGCDRFGGPT